MAKASTRILLASNQHWSCELKTRQDPTTDFANLKNVIARSKGIAEPTLRALFRSSHTETNWELFGEDLCAPGKTASSVPCIFENHVYSLTVKPNNGARIIACQHPTLRDLQDSLDEEDGVFRGTWKSGNDVGWFPLVIQYFADGKLCEAKISWQVWPTKLDYASDFQSLANSVGNVYPLWLYRFTAPTEHDVGKSQQAHERFPLLWLKQFEALFEQLKAGVRIVIRAPHQRLALDVQNRRADVIRGPLSARLEEAVVENITEPNRLYRIERMRSSLDTPENRFVKHALQHCLLGLENIEKWIESPSLSPHLRTKFQSWTRTLLSNLSSPIFKSLGAFDGLTHESLVLYNRAGYSQVYRTWLELRHYLEFFAQKPKNQIGMREISELYEIWCFLEIRQILLELGFVEQVDHARKPQLKTVGLEKRLVNGLGAAFHFAHKDNEQFQIRLAHEPVFTRLNGTNKEKAERIQVYSVTQKPDILLEAKFPATSTSDQHKGYWVFDAKYRIKQPVPKNEDRDEDRTGDYLVPPEAIDQMHRYRDSLFLRAQDQKSRPILGAFALYPGVFDQSNDPSANPYFESIQEVAVGAFPLLPCELETGHRWLKQYLQTILNTTWASNISKKSVAIPPSGLELGLPGMTLLFPVPGDPSKPRSSAYMDRMRSGKQRWYHTYKDTRFCIDIQTVATARYFAPIMPLTDIPGSPLGIIGVYELFTPQCRKRYELTEEMTGIASEIPTNEKECWLFELRGWRELQQPIELSGAWDYTSRNWFQYADFMRILQARSWDEIGSVTQNPWTF